VRALALRGGAGLGRLVETRPLDSVAARDGLHLVSRQRLVLEQRFGNLV